MHRHGHTDNASAALGLLGVRRMSEGRRREMEQERQAREFAGALVKELTRVQQQRIQEQAARERWLKLSPEERKKCEQRAADAEHQRMQEYADGKEQARQSHGGSLDSMQVILTVFSYIDIYKWIHRDDGDFPPMPRWAAPLICLCLFVSCQIGGRVTEI